MYSTPFHTATAHVAPHRQHPALPAPQPPSRRVCFLSRPGHTETHECRVALTSRCAPPRRTAPPLRCVAPSIAAANRNPPTPPPPVPSTPSGSRQLQSPLASSFPCLSAPLLETRGLPGLTGGKEGRWKGGKVERWKGGKVERVLGRPEGQGQGTDFGICVPRHTGK